MTRRPKDVGHDHLKLVRRYETGACVASSLLSPAASRIPLAVVQQPCIKTYLYSLYIIYMYPLLHSQ